MIQDQGTTKHKGASTVADGLSLDRRISTMAVIQLDESFRASPTICIGWLVHQSIGPSRLIHALPLTDPLIVPYQPTKNGAKLRPPDHKRKYLFLSSIISENDVLFSSS